MQKKIVVAKVFVINAEGLVLALRRSKTDPRKPLTWDLPGGEVEYGEDPTVAAAREAQEEAGIEIENLRVIDVSSTNISKDLYIIRLLFYAFIEDVEIKISYEHDQYKWVTKDEFIKLDIPDVYKDPIKFLPSKP